MVLEMGFEIFGGYMKKAIISSALFLIVSFSTFTQESQSPMWTWGYTEAVTLKGKKFIGSKAGTYGISDNTYADSYREQDGYALVVGRKIHYWLYDTITYHSGNATEIYNKVVPTWAEKMGYVVDYDNIEVYNPNPDLATSVRTLMSQRGCDVSVAFVTDDPSYDYIVINEYLNSKGVYKTTIYYIYR
jgi:hypothetical protein